MRIETGVTSNIGKTDVVKVSNL